MSRHTRVWAYVDAVARAGSFRAAAERLSIAPSALQRRVRDVEEDLGAEVFERGPGGVRLTAAGEALIRWVRAQAADLDRVRGQVEDLKGLRGGLVRVVCSQALASAFLPREIAAYAARHPRVRFSASVRDHGGCLNALRGYEADLALVFRPVRHPDFQPIAVIPQRLVAVVAAGHPLAARSVVRVRDCATYPLALLDQGFAGRRILDDTAAAGSVAFAPHLESNSFELLREVVRQGTAVTFQVEVGAEVGALSGEGLVVLPVDDRDGARGPLVLGQLRGRALPVAVARFADQLARALEERRP